VLAVLENTMIFVHHEQQTPVLQAKHPVQQLMGASLTNC